MTLSLPGLLLVFIFGGCLCLYIIFVLKNAIAFAQSPESEPILPADPPSISVIIPARNEADGIESCLKTVLNQTYPKDRFEVILINDHSTDDTAAIARKLATEYPQLKVVDLTVSGIYAYKKAALEAGLALATGTIILQTDADCQVGEEWIATMIGGFDEDTGFVSGPVSLTSKSSLLEIFQELESMGLILIGAGSMMRKRPNMCNGANMGFQKKVFDEVGGYAGINHIASGDDELLMQKIVLQGKYKLKFVKSPSAIVKTAALTHWETLKTQRLRWVSKVRHYPRKSANLIQIIAYLGFCSFPILLVAGFWNTELWRWMGGLFVLKVLADYLLMYQAAVFFHKLQKLWYVIPLQFVYIPYVIWVGIAGNFVKHYTWKGRKVQ